MKAIFQASEQLRFEVEATDQKQLFEEIATISEIFSYNSCGACNSTDIKFVCRENDGNKFYEVKCAKCGAKLSFGAHKNNKTLFPHKKDSQGNWLPNNGWTKYIKSTT